MARHTTRMDPVGERQDQRINYTCPVAYEGVVWEMKNCLSGGVLTVYLVSYFPLRWD